EERLLQTFDQVLGAGEVQLEQPVEDGRVLTPLDQRRAQRTAKGGAILHSDEQRRLRRVGDLGGRDPQAVLPQQAGEVLEALVHGPHASVRGMWMLVLVAGALLDRGRPALDAGRPGLRGEIAMGLAGPPASLPSTQRALASSNEDKLKRLRAAGAVAEVVLTTPELEARRPWALLQRNFVNGQAYDADDLPPLPVV